ncbi:Interleukin-12 subunit beta [Oryzias melastigma]|uniref:Interleukin-12 subunit beta n=1 Tax=Oryzias melastigma TaxID=30732 RepID=A0A834CLD1_ORYME|nr:Interleukin-12 subunit beta [Oryzias melastigma]
MKLLVLCLFSAFLLISCQNPKKQWALLPNILVVEVDGTLGQQPLSCLEEHNQSQSISWKKNGAPEPQTGNLYMVQLVESLGGGNYTCHSEDGSLLNYTELLIYQEDPDSRRILVKGEKEDYLNCSAQSYSGEFRCSWTWHSSRVGKVAFVIVERFSGTNSTQCSQDAVDQHWICSSGYGKVICSVDDDGRGISCLDEQHCPYAEEHHPIHVTVFVRTEHFLLESYSKFFFMSEIVKPDKVRIGRVNTTVIEWTYPSSWSRPHSYFPLTFQIAQLKGRCRKCDNSCAGVKPKHLTVQSTDSCQFKVKHRTKTVCVRAKDAFCNSQWSDWSHMTLKKIRMNKVKKKDA